MWPENWSTACTFASLVTQWRVGLGGRSGLDYAAIPVALRLGGVKRSEWAHAFDGIRVMEDAALEYLSDQQEKRARRGR